MTPAYIDGLKRETNDLQSLSSFSFLKELSPSRIQYFLTSVRVEGVSR